MKYCAVVVFSFFVLSVIFNSAVNAKSINDNPYRNRREIPDECRPRPFYHRGGLRNTSDESSSGEKNGPPLPPPPPPMCCETPDVMNPMHEVFGKCHRLVHETLNLGSRKHHRHHHHHHSSLKPIQEPLSLAPVPEETRYRREADETEDSSSSKEDSHTDKWQEKKECFMSCVFNASGFILPDDMLNEELLSQKLKESIGNETKWTPIADSAFKKCIAAAKEANSQSQKTCKSGPHEYLKCMSRELFFNCPTDIWNNSQECTEMKEKMEKCPNLAPPPPHRHHHHHHHRKHHKHNHENRY